MKIFRVIARIIIIILALYSLAGYLGLKYLFINAYIFGEVKATLAVFILMIIVLGIPVVFTIRSSSNNQLQIKPVQNFSAIASIFQKISSFIWEIFFIVIMVVLFLSQRQQPSYDLIYAYGSPESLVKVSVQNQKITAPSNNLKFYYYNFKSGMTFHKTTWEQGESPRGEEPHEIPIKNINRLNIISQLDTSPDNKMKIISMLASNGCVLKVNGPSGMSLPTYESDLRYDSCMMVGWIKNLY